MPSKHEHIRNAKANDKCYAIQLTNYRHKDTWSWNTSNTAAARPGPF